MTLYVTKTPQWSNTNPTTQNPDGTNDKLLLPKQYSTAKHRAKAADVSESWVNKGGGRAV